MELPYSLGEYLLLFCESFSFFWSVQYLSFKVVRSCVLNCLFYRWCLQLANADEGFWNVLILVVSHDGCSNELESPFRIYLGCSAVGNFLFKNAFPSFLKIYYIYHSKMVIFFKIIDKQTLLVIIHAYLIKHF